MFHLFSRVLSSATKLPVQIPTVRSLLPAFPTLPSLLVPQPLLTEQVRTVVKYSALKGKRKTVKTVLKRFFRLHWGGWIRTKAGRHRKLWAKTAVNRRQRKEHVLCNATQSLLLDRMVSAYWRRPKYYIEDPYTPYHTREHYYVTRRKPWRPEGWE